MQNLTDYTNNIAPSNTLKDSTQKNLSANYSEFCSEGVNNLVFNSNLSYKNIIK